MNLSFLNKIKPGIIVPLTVLFVILFDIGITHKYGWIYLISVYLYLPLFLLNSLKTFLTLRQTTSKLFVITTMILAFIALVCLIALQTPFFILENNVINIILVFLIIIDFAEKSFVSLNQILNPALTFVATFFGIILIGSALLMMPNSSTKEMHYIDALFTSTSAVCVTGLTVLDTGKDFTGLGQAIILILIQVGGLGILVFTNLFGILFKGEKSYKDLIFLQELISADSLQNTFRSLQKIVGFVFIVEFIGTMCVLYACPNEGLFFAVFHSISAFCNAGFSTLTNSLYEVGFKYNYNFHLAIAFLIIIGGFGYNIAFNIVSVYKYRLQLLLFDYSSVFKPKKPGRVKWGLNTALVVWTTLILLIFGTVTFFYLEYNNTLSEHGLYGKLVTSFFASVTPRTAGFNSIDMTQMLSSTVMIYLLLMWIGASPGSTGGGIKTTAFAIASLNLLNQIRGEKLLILMNKTIPTEIVSRIMTIIALSLIAIGLGMTMILSLQPDLNPLHVAFECFSAYGTVGLTLGLTAKLTTASKIIIILLMFLGRVSFLNFLIALFSTFMKKKNAHTLEYPETKIFVN